MPSDSENYGVFVKDGRTKVARSRAAAVRLRFNGWAEKSETPSAEGPAPATAADDSPAGGSPADDAVTATSPVTASATSGDNDPSSKKDPSSKPAFGRSNK